MTATVAGKHRTGLSGWASSGRSDWLPALRYCGGVYLVIRVALFLLSAAAWGLATEHPSVTPFGTYPTITNGWHNIITGWNKQDANWFLEIARDGYSDTNGSAAFYPAYPLLIRIVGFLFLGHQLPAAYVVSNGALVAALVILYRLTEREFGTDFARRSVLYLAVFPTAFFLFDTYSEALFLLAAVGAFYLARSGRWGWAGLTAVVAALTRSMGVVVALALAVEAVHQAIEERRGQVAAPDRTGLLARTALFPRTSLFPRTALRLGASALPLAAILGYLLFWQLRYHDWSRPLRLEKVFWERQFSMPWATLWHGLTDAVSQGPVGNDAWWTLDFVLVAAAVLLGIWVAVRTRPIYAVYTWASILVFLSEAVPGRPLASDPRYLVTLFPLMWPLAFIGRRPQVHEAIVGLSAASMGIVAWLFLVTTNVF
ncbi:MAG: hypothetical protein J2P28_14075 [Actinobacteria bacterium]|nr:hypothetical protein [Actinomycetota bacterium]